MAIELKVPSVGESVTVVEIGRWLKNEGDTVGADEPLTELETDKATQELLAPAAGRVGRILKKQGEQAEIGEVIGYIEEGDGAVATKTAPDRQHKGEKAAAKDAAKEVAAGSKPEATREDKGKGSPKATERDSEQLVEKDRPQGAQGETPHVMPAAQRLLDQHGLEADEVEATGPGGRLLKEDVQRHVEAGAPESRPAPAAEQPRPQSSAQRTTSAPPRGAREEEAVPMSPLRRKIAQRLVEAQQTAALLTTFNEVDMSGVMALRNQYKEAFQQKHGVKLGFMSFFVKAAIESLKEYPAINAEVRGTNIVYKNYYDIGVAIGSGKGLVVPVIRDADRLSFAQIEKTIGDYAKKVQENKISLEDLQGGTFTITNGGVYGSMLSTPIVNPPQSGILGMHAITERPMAIKGEVKIRPMMYVALTYDHRIVDGREAVSFLKRLKDVIEDPSRMLLEA